MYEVFFMIGAFPTALKNMTTGYSMADVQVYAAAHAAQQEMRTFDRVSLLVALKYC